MSKIDLTLLILMTASAVWTVMGRSLLKATVGLAITSILISAIIFRLNSPLAAVFELSVCAGLMTVIFVSAISLTKPLTPGEIKKGARERMKRFRYMPLLMAAAAACFLLLRIPSVPVLRENPSLLDPRNVMWNIRQLDLFGQIIIIITGAIGVVILFEEKKLDDW